MTNKTMLAIADKYHKTAAQVSLRWLIQQGIVPLPKSVHEERMIQNTAIFDFALTNDEMRKINLLTNLGGQCADPDNVDF